MKTGNTCTNSSRIHRRKTGNWFELNVIAKGAMAMITTQVQTVDITLTAQSPVNSSTNLSTSVARYSMSMWSEEPESKRSLQAASNSSSACQKER